MLTLENKSEVVILNFMYIKGENDYHFENSKMQNINPISKDSKQIKMTLIHFLIAHSIFSPYT